MKKLIIVVCLIVLTFSVVGFKLKMSPKMIELEKTSIQQLTFKYNSKKNSTEVAGAITNNSPNTYKTITFDVIYLNADNSQKTIQTIQLKDIKAGTTKTFSEIVENNNVSKNSYELHIDDLYYYVSK